MSPVTRIGGRDMTETVSDQDQAAAGLTVQRYAQLVEQRRYELSVGATGLPALLEPYAVSVSSLTIPSQRTAEPTA